MKSIKLKTYFLKANFRYLHNFFIAYIYIYTMKLGEIKSILTKSKVELNLSIKVHIKDTDIVSVSLLQTFNKVRPRHMFKI